MEPKGPSAVDFISRVTLRSPRPLIWLIQLCIFAVSGVVAFLVRFEFRLNTDQLQNLAWALPVWIASKVLLFRLLHLDRGWWRYTSVPDFIRIGIGNLAGSAASGLVILLVGPSGFPRSVIVLDLLICAHATGGVRLLTRAVREFALRSGSGEVKPIAIYGAGRAGVALLQEIRANQRLDYDVRGFIDDDPSKKGMRVQGVTVLGSGADLRNIAGRLTIAEVLVAIPSVDGRAMNRILQHCRTAGLHCKTIPSLGEIIEGRSLTPQIREVAVEDLLGRVPVRLNQLAIRAKLQDHVVVVTGAAGSIGSELCRQVARFRPSAIIGFEIAETPLFDLDQEMRASFPDVPFHPEIGDVRDPLRLADVFERYRPSILYHAAAYKHVPMMESAVFSAIENNLFGTSNVAQAAAAYGIADFVMISSDKAVRPTSVMGLTKRASELVIGSLQNGSTKFVSVRFGNVLGSNGSVIPTFKKQIAKGGPVTVTHPEMRRYFMTIPEAVQLVLQASTMGTGGEIFVLDMGQPVKIIDLARNLILLSGHRPDEEIRIQITGLRPGEKLYEELHLQHEDMLPTFHEKIKIFAGPVIGRGVMEARLRSLRHHCVVRDLGRVLLELKELVPEYNPSLHILNGVINRNDFAALGAAKAPASSSGPLDISAAAGRPN